MVLCFVVLLHSAHSPETKLCCHCCQEQALSCVVKAFNEMHCSGATGMSVGLTYQDYLEIKDCRTKLPM